MNAPLAWTHARAHRVPVVVVVCVAVAITLKFLGQSSVGFGSAPVRFHWFLVLLVAVSSTIPLDPPYGVLGRVWVRALSDRLLRLFWCATAMACGLIGTQLATTSGATLGPWLLLLGAVSLATATRVPDRAWLTTLGLGGGSILIDHLSLDLPVSRAVEGLGWTWAVVLLGCAAFLYAVGPLIAAISPRP